MRKRNRDDALTASKSYAAMTAAPAETYAPAATAAETTAVPDAYGETYRAALTEAVNPAPFSYDPAADPAWQAYKKAYTREGRRAAEDTLGAYAAMTGGVPSTAAVTAAQQAGDYYAAQLADKIPELYQLAYDMYDAAEARRMKALSALRDARGDELARWDAEQSRLADQRDFDYRSRRDARDYDYQLRRDAYADKVALAKLASEVGDDSGLAGLGIDLSNKGGKYYAYGADGAPYEIGSAKGKAFVETAAPGQTMTGGDGSTWTRTAEGVSIARDGKTWTLAIPNAEAEEAAAATGRSAGYGGSGGSAKPTLTAAQVTAALKNGVRSKTVLDAYEYYYGEPFAETEAGDAAGAGEWPVDQNSVLALGYGPISAQRLAELVASGAVEQYLEDGSWHFRRAGSAGRADLGAPSFTDRVGARLG